MTMTAALLRLYPGAFRDRWGEDLRAEADVAGWRSWPNLVTGAVDMWLHPAIWPAGWPAQRASRSAAMAMLVTIAAWLVAHFTTESGRPAYTLALNGAATLLVLGLALLAPLPRSRALAPLLSRSLRRLAFPLLLATAAVIAANSKFAPTEWLRVPVLAAWWGSWAFGLIAGCRIVAGLGPDLVLPPGPRRTRLGIAVLTGASLAAACAVAVFAARHVAPLPALLAIGTALSVAACVTALRDLVAE
ncbi:MAG TPA: hypothetical protein VG247_16390 [Pseudonocardiaceae bacterium]|jgi:hypothetical protein|nr:hypothetical protein [Pseudonocardiaceae bacterium]